MRQEYRDKYITKFDSPFTCYLYEKVVLQGVGDEHTSNPDWGDWADRIGRRIVIGDSQGFVRSERYDDEGKAAVAFADYDLQMMGEGEEEEE